MRIMLGRLLAASILTLAACAHPAFAGQRAVGETAPASSYIEVVCVDPLTGVAAACASGGGGGAGTEYTEDAAGAANPTAPSILCRRRDTLTVSEVSADGDWVGCLATSKGQMHVFAEISGGATSANQATQITAEQAVLAVLGSQSNTTPCAGDSSACTVQAQLQRIMSLQTLLNGKIDTLNTTVSSTTPTDTYSQPNAGASYGLVPAVSTAVETGRVIKNAPGNLYGFNVTTGATAGNILVFNATTVPAAGAVTPVKCYTVAANSTLEMGFTPPLYLGTGISIAFSSAASCFTKTDSATAFISGDAK